MKWKVKFFIFSISLVIVIAFAGCTKLCRSGYDGSNCNTESRLKFEGVWNAVDTPGNITYMDTIAPGGNISAVTLSKAFAGHFFSHNINAVVSGNTVTISLQQPDSALYTVQGTGTMDSKQSTISWSYQLINAADTIHIISNFGGTWTR
jgi:hypothetical protein